MTLKLGAVCVCGSAVDPARADGLRHTQHSDLAFAAARDTAADDAGECRE